MIEAIILALSPILAIDIIVSVLSGDLSLINPANWNLFGWSLAVIWVIFVVYNYEGKKDDE